MALNRGVAPDSAAQMLTSGPSRLCQALGLTRQDHNGLDLLDPDSPLQLRNDGFRVGEVLVSPRIGIKHAVEWPLRFALPENSCVSGPKSWPKISLGWRPADDETFIGRCIFIRYNSVHR